MPNHVQNELILPQLTLSDLDKLVNQAGNVDFEILLPIPLNYWWGSVGSIEEKTFPGNALDWCSKNWSTKWNAYQCKPAELHNAAWRLQFQTAWRPPYGWFNAILNTFQQPFSYTYMDEGDDRAFSGRFYKDSSWGWQWKEVECSDEETERMYQMRWGRSRAEMEAD